MGRESPRLRPGRRPGGPLGAGAAGLVPGVPRRHFTCERHVRGEGQRTTLNPCAAGDLFSTRSVISTRYQAEWKKAGLAHRSQTAAPMAAARAPAAAGPKVAQARAVFPL